MCLAFWLHAVPLFLVDDDNNTARSFDDATCCETVALRRELCVYVYVYVVYVPTAVGLQSLLSLLRLLWPHLRYRRGNAFAHRNKGRRRAAHTHAHTHTRTHTHTHARARMHTLTQSCENTQAPLGLSLFAPILFFVVSVVCHADHIVVATECVATDNTFGERSLQVPLRLACYHGQWFKHAG